MAEDSVALKPTDAVRRILAASGAVIPDKEGYWLGFHMERFVKHVRKTGELLDLPTASEAYLAFIKTAVPALPDWQVAQVKQALLLFARGIEGWRWVRATGEVGKTGKEASGGWMLRYRVKAGGVNASVAAGQSEVSPEGAPRDLEVLMEKLKRSVRVNHYSIRTEQTYLEWVRRF